jgi:structural maintenance of chromosome 2
VAFDRSLSVRCVTQEGDVFDPSGTLTGGSRPTTSVLARLQTYHDALQAMHEANARFDELSHALSRARENESQATKLRDHAELARRNLDLLKVCMSTHSLDT